jgi:hypothetical protein
MGASVRASDGEVESIPVAALSDMTPPAAVVSAPPIPAGPDRFSAWSLIPFGVGQFAQGRHVAGSIYGGLQVGLLAWHVAAASRASSYDGPNLDDFESRRKQRNVSGALLVGAAVASIIEAVVLGTVASD